MKDVILGCALLGTILVVYGLLGSYLLREFVNAINVHTYHSHNPACHLSDPSYFCEE